MKIRLLSMAILFAATTFSSCKKDNESTELKIRMTDNPYDATEVNVDLQQVRVNYNDDDGGWIDLETKTGIYNLLDFQAGIDTLIARNQVPLGTLKEIRFVLGSRNSIVIDDIVYPLTIPSGSESGLKIKMNKVLKPGTDSLLIDFDAALSIILNGNGSYHLKPVLKIK